MRFGARVGCGARDGAGIRAGPGPGGLPRRGREAGWASGRRLQPKYRVPQPCVTLSGRHQDRSGAKWPQQTASTRQGEAAQCGLWKDWRRHDGTPAAAVC